MLSNRQASILQFIDNYRRLHGRSPTQREIAAEVGYRSVGGLNYQIRELERLGHLRRERNRPGTLAVVDGGAAPGERSLESPPEESVRVPLCGTISAGIPLLAQENVESVFLLPRRLVGYGDVFLLEVRGDSMLYEAILDGDWVAVRAQQTADDGQVVAALVRNATTGEDEATIKVLRRHKSRAWLEPRNRGYPQIPYREAAILGVVVAVLRSMPALRRPAAGAPD